MMLTDDDKAEIAVWAGKFAASAVTVVIAVLILFGVSTVIDRGERWHCERYQAER